MRGIGIGGHGGQAQFPIRNAVGAERQGAVCADRAGKFAFRSDAAFDIRVHQPGDEIADIGPFGRELHGERTLTRCGYERVGIDALRDVRLEPETVQAGAGQQQRIAAALVEASETGAHVAPHGYDLYVAQETFQHGATPDADRRNPRPRRQVEQIPDPGVRTRNQGVPGVGTRAGGGQSESVGDVDGHVLHAVRCEIRASVEECIAQGVDENALARTAVAMRRFPQRSRQVDIASGRYSQQFDCQRRVGFPEPRSHEVGLDEGQRAASGGDAKRWQLGLLPAVAAAAAIIARRLVFRESESDGSIMANDGDTGNPDRDDAKPSMWGGRFSEPTNEFVARFTASVDVDRRLYRHDIQGSIAHANALAAAGVLTDADRDDIVGGLRAIRAEIERGEFVWNPALEDVHMNIEARLTELVGEAGKRLHAGRSRNDQVATDMRLWLRDRIDGIDRRLTDLMTCLVDRAGEHTETVVPGLTHLQTAQPITFGHHLMAWFEMASRDRERFRDCRKRVNVSPLGSAALAGTTFVIDREASAAELGFAAVAANSLDAVSDRDFAIEFCAAASLAAVHLSRWCEELVLWISPQWRFVGLPDAFCTGSSIMPQKKNPDVPELIRGKCGRVIGNLNALLVLMKGQPLAYNRDNQEDKPPLFDSADVLCDCLEAMAAIVSAMAPDPAAMRAAAATGFAAATDFADYLVRRGVPFRNAHEIVGRAVALADERGVPLDAIPFGDLGKLSDVIGEGVYDVLTLDAAVAARDHVGGTAPAAVRAAIDAARRRL